MFKIGTRVSKITCFAYCVQREAGTVVMTGEHGEGPAIAILWELKNGDTYLNIWLLADAERELTIKPADWQPSTPTPKPLEW